MSSNFEKAVKGGTKVKLAPPKSKYVEQILLATNTGDAGVAEVFRTLTHRLRDSTWTVAFKSLIIVHLMVKEGAQEVTLRYLSAAPKVRLAINQFTDVQTQGQNIRRYSDYLIVRSQAFGATKCDYVRSGDGRMRRLTVDKGLLRETEVVQDQIRALVKCDFFSSDADNEISLTAFRLLIRDLLDLYNVENEAVMNVLSRYFEMSKPDAERAIKIYKNFCKQTDQVVQYLSVGRQYEHATRLEIPKIKHAPTSLVNSLQEYLDDQDFEVNRRQYLTEQDAKKSGKPFSKLNQQSTSQPTQQSKSQSAAVQSTQPSQTAASAAPPQQAKGPAPDLIDFFDSIEQNQQPMAQSVPQYQQQPTGFQQSQMTGYPSQQQPQQAFGFQQAPQQTSIGSTNPFGQQQQPVQMQQTGIDGFAASNQSTNPFGQPQQQQQQPQIQPLQTQFTGAGFGGYGPQPSQQQYTSPVQMQPSAPVQSPQVIQPQPTGSTNPFRQSMMPTGAGAAFGSGAFGQTQDPQRQNTNPFAKDPQQAPPMPGNAFAQQQQQAPSAFAAQQQPPQPQPLQAQATGTNPFARTLQQPTPPMSPPNALQVQPTGSTNPFRQSAFVNQQTGTGWQNAPQATMGGFENLETVPVFPRPGQVQQQQSPWG